MRIALCHEWLTTYGGSEQVAKRIASALGITDVFAFTVDPDTATRLFPSGSVQAAHPMGQTQIAQRHWQSFLPVMPYAWSRLDLSDFDLVITSSHCSVNAIRTGPDTQVISYCHTPMRYAWDWRAELGRFPSLLRPLWPLAAAAFRASDRHAADRVAVFVANSRNVAERIRLCYGRDSEVIYPPVDIDFWTPDSSANREDYFLYAGRLVPYKRVDIAIAAANLSGLPLVVAGSGPELVGLQRTAGPSVRFVTNPSDFELRELYRRARALVFPGVEDFGMTLVEAQACGTPVIANARGGAREAVRDGVTGVLLADSSAEGFSHALATFEPERYALSEMRAHVTAFSVQRFDRAIRELVLRVGEATPTAHVRTIA